MSYCRFRNTLDDLRDCFANMDAPIPDQDEARARAHLVEVCAVIVKEYEGAFDGKPDAMDDANADAA